MIRFNFFKRRKTAAELAQEWEAVQIRLDKITGLGFAIHSDFKNDLKKLNDAVIRNLGDDVYKVRCPIYMTCSYFLVDNPKNRRKIEYYIGLLSDAADVIEKREKFGIEVKVRESNFDERLGNFKSKYRVKYVCGKLLKCGFFGRKSRMIDRCVSGLEESKVWLQSGIVTQGY